MDGALSEAIYRGGQLVRGFGLSETSLDEFGLGQFSTWPPQLLAYRKRWEPFIAAHLAIWRALNAAFEGSQDSANCPPPALSEISKRPLDFCHALNLTRMRLADDPAIGIVAQWNAFHDQPASYVVQNAATILKYYQDVVVRVGGPYKDELVEIGEQFGIAVTLPPVPDFTLQELTIAQIQGAGYVVAGVLEIVGYKLVAGHKAIIKTAINANKAIAAGLQKAAQEIVAGYWSTQKVIGVTAVIAVAVVGAGLLVYYVPKRKESA